MAKFIVVQTNRFTGSPLYYTEAEKIPAAQWQDSHTYAFSQYLLFAKFYGTEELAAAAQANIGMVHVPTTVVRELNADEVAVIQGEVDKLTSRGERWPGLFDNNDHYIAKYEALLV